MLLLLMLVPIIRVSAITYYGDYYPYKMNTEEYIEENNQIKRQEFQLYNTYNFTPNLLIIKYKNHA